MANRPYLRWNRDVAGVTKNSVKNAGLVAGVRVAQSNDHAEKSEPLPGSDQTHVDDLDWKKEKVKKALDKLKDVLHIFIIDQVLEFSADEPAMRKLIKYLTKVGMSEDEFYKKNRQDQIDILEKAGFHGLKDKNKRQATIVKKRIEFQIERTRKYFEDMTYGYGKRDDQDYCEGLVVNKGYLRLSKLNIAKQISEKKEFKMERGLPFLSEEQPMEQKRLVVKRYDQGKVNYALKQAVLGEGKNGDPNAIFTVYTFISDVIVTNWNWLRGGDPHSVYVGLERAVKTIVPWNAMPGKARDNIADYLEYLASLFEPKE
jgi:hypothetical protein